MNCWPWMFCWLALRPSQRWTWPSMMKISSPSFVLIHGVSPDCCTERCVPPALRRQSYSMYCIACRPCCRTARRCCRRPSPCGRNGSRCEISNRCGVISRPSASLISSILNSILPSPSMRIIAGMIGHRDAGLLGHDLGDGAGLDAVVHRHPALVRDRLLELHVLHRLEDVVLVLLCDICRFLSFVLAMDQASMTGADVEADLGADRAQAVAAPAPARR